MTGLEPGKTLRPFLVCLLDLPSSFEGSNTSKKHALDTKRGLLVEGPQSALKVRLGWQLEDLSGIWHVKTGTRILA